MTSSFKFMGVDPGKSGCVAVIDWFRSVVSVHRLSGTAKDLFDFVGELANETRFAVIEKVHSSPQMGVKSAFTFGQYYERPKQTLICCNIPFDEARPQVWQKVMGCMSKGEKNVTKARAQELFPNFKITHAVADALLLAEYARREWAK